MRLPTLLLQIACACSTAAAAPLSSEQTIRLFAGGGTNLSGPAVNCRIHAPFGIDGDAQGNIYIVEMKDGERLLKVNNRGILSVVAGTGATGNSGDDGPALQAQFNGMHSLAVHRGGNIFLADTWNQRVRKVDPASGKVSAFAGTGRKGFSGDGGPALAAEFGGIYCVALDRGFERLYLVDLDNRRIRAVDLQTGIVRTVAGNGQKGIPADGAEAINAPLVDPRAAALDARGNLYILERSGHALRVVDPAGKIRTLAGDGIAGLESGAEDAKKIRLSGPKHLWIDSSDQVIIADTDNHLIRQFFPRENRIVRLAGVGKAGAGGIGGAAGRAEFNQPHGVYLDKAGALYIADSLNNRVLKCGP